MSHPPAGQGNVTGQTATGTQEDATACCVVCCRRFPLSELAWEATGLLCPLCQAENVCGCSDD